MAQRGQPDLEQQPQPELEQQPELARARWVQVRLLPELGPEGDLSKGLPKEQTSLRRCSSLGVFCEKWALASGTTR